MAVLVVQANAGTQSLLDSGFRRNDGKNFCIGGIDKDAVTHRIRIDCV
jgi:hypothetical protein